MANPSETHKEPAQPNHHHTSSSFEGKSVQASDPVLQHNHVILSDWTAKDQSILEEALSNYACNLNINCYAKITRKLHNKTLRDVVFRCTWMSKRENSKRRKEDHSLMEKSKDRKEKMTDTSASSSNLAAQTGFLPYTQDVISNSDTNPIFYSEWTKKNQSR